MNLVLPLLLICIPSSVALVRCVFPSDLISSQAFWKKAKKEVGQSNLWFSHGADAASKVFECGYTNRVGELSRFNQSDSYLIGFPETGGCPNIPFDCKANLTFHGPIWMFKQKTYLDSAAKCCESVGENCLENAPEFTTTTRRQKPTKPKRMTTRPPSATTAATTTQDPKRPNATRLFKHDHDYDSRQQVGLLITVYSAIVAVLCGGAAVAFALEMWSYMARK